LDVNEALAFRPSTSERVTTISSNLTYVARVMCLENFQMRRNGSNQPGDRVSTASGNRSSGNPAFFDDSKQKFSNAAFQGAITPSAIHLPSQALYGSKTTLKY
jgi:hypothetical protein